LFSTTVILADRRRGPTARTVAFKSPGK